MGLPISDVAFDAAMDREESELGIFSTGGIACGQTCAAAFGVGVEASQKHDHLFTIAEHAERASHSVLLKRQAHELGVSEGFRKAWSRPSWRA
jgi:hypothetical protein